MTSDYYGHAHSSVAVMDIFVPMLIFVSSKLSNSSASDTSHTVSVDIDIDCHPVFNAKNNPHRYYYVRFNGQERNGGVKIPLSAFG